MSPLALPAIHTGAKNIVSIEAYHARMWAGTLASGAWPSGNRAIYMPFVLEDDAVVHKLFSCNGATASGNQDIGVYDAAGNRLVSTGSHAQSGTNAIQATDVADFYLRAGLYYLALANSGTTGTYHRTNSAADTLRTFGILQQASALALPSTMTGATVASAYLPVCGISTKDPT